MSQWATRGVLMIKVAEYIAEWLKNEISVASG